jgi:hypothetical protein
VGEPARDPLKRLRTFESARRAEARFGETPAQDHAFGPDPYRVAVLGDGRLAGVLRGEDALVLLDGSLQTLARVPTPRSPSAVVVYQGRRSGALRAGDILVGSEIEPVLAHYRADGTALDRLPDVPLRDVVGVRDLATGPEGVVYAVEEHDDRLLTLHFTGESAASTPTRREQRVGRGPIRVVRTRGALFVTMLIDHAITAFRVDARGDVGDPVSTVRIDGPFWGMDAIDGSGAEALLLAGGVEDHPLDRTGGFFGYVDSFVYVYRWSGGYLERIAAINASEHGVIVPKAMAFDRRATDGAVRALVTGYGGSTALRLAWTQASEPPSVRAVKAVPGTSAMVAIPAQGGGFALADPLLDAWVAIDAEGATEPKITRASAVDGRTDHERLGEALFFTGLMAPASSAEGPRSRFSCETCHFEGYVDGRTHHTGRGDVHATTKPLVGLFNNRPHFSRALDPDLSAVAENEFRVAGAPSPADPHFELDVRGVPWLAELGATPRLYDATELRLALMAFLMRWTHRTNPRAAEARPFTAEELRGAKEFRDRCERCHEARTAADDPTSRVPFERWERLTLGGGGPIVWASDAYEKTGVVPYVHERGARVPSLRRLYKKRPYFTNGSAPDITSVLAAARVNGPTFSHAGATEGEELDESTAHAIAAFVDLL